MLASNTLEAIIAEVSPNTRKPDVPAVTDDLVALTFRPVHVCG